ncbi:MAG: alpha/beta hydrolase family esterase [Acidimicrobiales bacterium]
MERTFLLAPGPSPEAPLLMVLHGTGTNGKGMAAFTGLARRGPAAGFATVFPDGLGEVWDRGRPLVGRESISDTDFLQALVGRLVSEGVARAGALWLAGMSNGAFFVEYLARRGLLCVRGIALVAGAATRGSQAGGPPSQAAAVLMFQGSADPVVPYGGGLIGSKGPFGERLSRLAAERGEEGGERVAVPAEEVAREWAGVVGVGVCGATAGGVCGTTAGGVVGATAGGVGGATAGGVGGATAGGVCGAVSGALSGGWAAPVVLHLPVAAGELPVTRMDWSVESGPPVVLYRIEGGGHTWPGGPQYLPVDAIGPVARGLDATGILLDMARSTA